MMEAGPTTSRRSFWSKAATRPFDHHDTNTLKLVAAPTLNPLAATLSAEADLGFAEHERAGVAMLSALLDLSRFLFLDRKGSFGHGLEPSLRYRIAA